MSKSVQKHRIVHTALAGGYASSIGGYRVLRKWALGQAPLLIGGTFLGVCLACFEFSLLIENLSYHNPMQFFLILHISFT